MYCIDYIRHFVTSQSITLYWDKPNKTPQGIIYRVLLNGELVKETNKTHCTIENLKDDQEYDVQVEVAVDGEIACDQIHGNTQR